MLWTFHSRSLTRATSDILLASFLSILSEEAMLRGLIGWALVVSPIALIFLASDLCAIIGGDTMGIIFILISLFLIYVYGKELREMKDCKDE